MIIVNDKIMKNIIILIIINFLLRHENLLKRFALIRIFDRKDDFGGFEGSESVKVASLKLIIHKLM